MTDDETIAVLSDLLDTTPQPLRLFLLLWQRRNKTVPQSALAEGIFDLTGARANAEAIRTAMKRLRPALSAACWPVDIQTRSGIGYGLVVTEPGWDWTEQWP